jgi:signal transduction histidine kinase
MSHLVDLARTRSAVRPIQAARFRFDVKRMARSTDASGTVDAQDGSTTARPSRLDGGRANRVVGAAAVIVVAALILFAVQLSSTQTSARQRVMTGFRDRADVISELTQAVLSSASAVATSEASRQPTAPTFDRRLLDHVVAQSHLAYALLLDQRAHVLASSRSITPAARAQVLGAPATRHALAGAPDSLSDVLPGAGAAGSAGAVIDLAVSVHTAAGRRVVVLGVPSAVLNAFLGAYLHRVPTPGGTAYVLDSRGTVVGARNGRPVVAHDLAGAVARRSSGAYGRNGYFVAVGVPGSTWRVVLTSTRSSLFSSVSGSRKWLPWIIFVALGLVALGFLAVLRRLLGSAVALSAAHARLATSNARLESSNALLRGAAELSRSNAELEQFASVASHDLQEPLRKVQTFAAQLTVMEHDRLSPEGQDFLRRMSDAAGRMRALIDDLLMFSRVSTQGRPFVAVDLGEIVDQVLVDLELSVEDTGARVSIGPLPSIEADPVQMRQLLQNLIGNALKFRRDGVVPELTVSAKLDDHVAELTVQDNGIGFDEQYATRIFRAFERLHGARAYAGTGIGLALCRKIVERHHGTIAATSEVGEGATFTVRLPREQPTDSVESTSLFPEANDREVSGALV